MTDEQAAAKAAWLINRGFCPKCKVRGKPALLREHNTCTRCKQAWIVKKDAEKKYSVIARPL